MSNVISFYKITDKERQKWLKEIVAEPKPYIPWLPIEMDPGFNDESDKYSGKLREAMKKYGSFKGRKK